MVKRMVSVFLCVLLLWLPLAGLAGEGTREITDMKGRQVSLPGEITRVVALAPADCEILFALGKGDTVVGRGMDCNYPEAAQEIPVVNSGMTTNIEQILALEPQVILMNTMAQTLEQVEALEAAGIPVVATDTGDIAGVYKAIHLIAEIVGSEPEGAALISGMQAAFDEIAQSSAGAETRAVYFEVSPLQYGLWTAGSGTFLNEIAEICGLTNLFADVEGWAEVSQEQIIDRDPGFIVTLFPGDGSGISPVDEIKGREGWSGITAVQKDGVMLADADAFSRPGPRLADAARALYALTMGVE